VFQDAPTNFDTDTYAFIINALQEISPLKYDAKAYFNGSQEQKEINRCYRVIADHIKANVFAIADGAVPNNKERGSILRRLIRRSMVCARKLKLNKEFLVTATNAIVEQFKDFYPYLVTFKQQIIEVLEKERKSFEITLDRGFKLFENEINGKNTIDTEVLFKLVDTYGFPYELIKELCVENSVKIDEVAYASRLELHRKISRANLEVKGMSTQATDLINLTVKSKFIYDELELKNSKIIAMFDTNFKQIKSSKNEC
jgi:alanyl-tRNA synthetase